MKHLYRVLLMALAFVWADVCYAQIDSDYSLSLIKGYDSFENGTYWFDMAQYPASEMFFEKAVRYFDEHLKEHPQDDSTKTYLGYSYYYLYFVYRDIKRTKEKEIAEYLEKALLYLPEDDMQSRFLLHYDFGNYLLLGDSLCGIAPNYCRAFREYDKAIENDFDFNIYPEFLPLYKNVLYQHETLLFHSYLNNLPDTTNLCGDTKEIPVWDTCIGDQQLDRCLDDLNRLIGIEQTEGNADQFDTPAFVLLGECYYYKGEYKKATECYEESGMVPNQLETLPATLYWDSYNKQGIFESEQIEALKEATFEGWRNNPTFYRSLYLDNANYENKVGAMSDMAHVVMGYFLEK